MVPNTNRQHAIWVGLIVLCIYGVLGLAVVPFHPDESDYIASARDYVYIFVENDFQKVAYDPVWSLPREQWLRLANAPLNKYLIGLMWDMGGFEYAALNDPWDHSRGIDANQASSTPSDKLLFMARMPSLAFLTGSLFLAYFIGRHLFNHWAAFVATTLLFVHPLVLLEARRATVEAGLIFFSLAIIGATLFAIRNLTWWRILLVGALYGLAFSMKYTAVIVILPSILVIAINSLLQARAGETALQLPAAVGRMLLQVGTCAVLTLVIYFAIHPVLWSNPLERIQEIREIRLDQLETQAQNDPAPLVTVTDRVRELGTQLFYQDHRLWEEPYGNSWLRGISLMQYNAGSYILIALAVLGATYLVYRRGTTTWAHWLILLWFGTAAVAILIVNPLPWPRYYLPVLVPLYVIVAAGIQHLIFLASAVYERLNENKMMVAERTE